MLIQLALRRFCQHCGERMRPVEAMWDYTPTDGERRIRLVILTCPNKSLLRWNHDRKIVQVDIVGSRIEDMEQVVYELFGELPKMVRLHEK